MKNKIPDDNVFRRLSPEPMPHIPEGTSAPINLRTAREIERDRVIDKLVADGVAPLKPGEPIPDTTAETVRGLRRLLGDACGPWQNGLRGPPKKERSHGRSARRTNRKDPP